MTSVGHRAWQARQRYRRRAQIRRSKGMTYSFALVLGLAIGAGMAGALLVFGLVR